MIGALFGMETLIPIAYFLLVFGVGLIGMGSFVVESGSMEPSIRIGSLVYVDQSFDAKEIAPDEVIAFKIDGANAQACTHRVVTNDIESQIVRTKGDSNKEIDATPIPYTDIIGRVVLSIPYLGYLSYFVSKNQVCFLCVYVAILSCTSLLYCFISKKCKGVHSRERRSTYGIKESCFMQRNGIAR